MLDEPTDGLDPVARKETRDLLLDPRARGKTVFLNSHLLGEVEQICDRVAILAAGNVVRQGTIDDLTAQSMCYMIELSAAESSGQGSGGSDQTLPTDPRPLTTDHQPPTPDHQPPTTDHRPLTTDHQPPTTDPRPPTTDRNQATQAVQAVIRAALPCRLAALLELAAPGSTELRESGVEAGQLPSGEKIELAGTTLRIACANARQIQPILDALRSRGLVIEAVRPVRQSLEDYFVQTITAGSAAGGIATPGRLTMTQTLAIFVDAYRNLNSRKLFWITPGPFGPDRGRLRLRGHQRARPEIPLLGVRLLRWSIPESSPRRSFTRWPS